MLEYIINYGINSIVSITLALFIFKIWIKQRLVGSIKYEYDLKLEKVRLDLQNELEKTKAKLANQNQKEIELLKIKLGTEYEIMKSNYFRYSEHQFTIYNAIWISLCDLEICVLNLWKEANNKNLKDLSIQLEITKRSLSHGALVIEHNHYIELKKTIIEFQDFKFGKEELISLRDLQKRDPEIIDDQDISRTIVENENKKIALLNHLNQIRHELKSQLACTTATTINSSRQDHNQIDYFNVNTDFD